MKFEDRERTSEDVQTTVKRYRINGRPVCSAWCGSESHRKMTCQFAISKDYGLSMYCFKSGEFIDTETLTPPVGCIVWKDEEVNRENQ